ncbi:MAG: DUF4124 domain-containing protein [Lysobacteraceae bacterium]|nr:MAG: DUF4124 domain-containing protein [Xanthomonadaceae bacterium]
MKPIRLLLQVAITFLSSAAFTSGATVYQWKDASGGLHFSDTPPPADAILIRGPARPPAAQAASADANQALQRDAADLAQGMPAVDPAARAADERKAAELRTQECEQLRQAGAALERRRSGESTEILTDHERAALPASIAEIDSKIASICP